MFNLKWNLHVVGLIYIQNIINLQNPNSKL